MSVEDLLNDFYKWEQQQQNNDDDNKKPIDLYFNEHIKKQGA
jgi:hypothetical protein